MELYNVSVSFTRIWRDEEEEYIDCDEKFEVWPLKNSRGRMKNTKRLAKLSIILKFVSSSYGFTEGKEDIH